MALPESVQQLVDQIGSRVSWTQRLWLTSAGIVLLTLAIGTMGIQASWHKNRSRLQSELTEQKDKSALLSTIDLNKKQIKRVEEKVLLPGGTSVLTSEVTRVASKAGLQIESVAPQPDVNFGPYTRFQIEVTATFAFLDLLKFLQSLEQHEPLLQVDQMELGEPPLPEGPFRPSREPNAPVSLETDRKKVRFLISAFARQGSSS